MYKNLLEFVSSALRSGVECTIESFGDIPELKDLRKIDLVNQIATFCDEHGIEINPPIFDSAYEIQDPRVFSRKKTSDEYEGSLVEALYVGEGHHVEYKSTFALDTKRLKHNPSASKKELISQTIMHEVVKTLVAFLNADGGCLLIGVDDDGGIVGIDQELKYLPNGSSLDKWELFFSDNLKQKIHDYHLLRGLISWKICSRNGLHICVAIVLPKPDRLSSCSFKEEYEDDLIYIREGNSSTRIRCKEIEPLVIKRLSF